MNMNTTLFSFIALALFTNVNAADSKKRGHNYSEVDAIATIQSRLAAVLHDFLEHNPGLQAEIAATADQEDEALASLMAQISLASAANDSNKRGRSRTEKTTTATEQANPIDGIMACCNTLLGTDTLTFAQFAAEFEKISFLIKNILNGVIQTEAKKALLQITHESELLENEHLTEIIIPGLMYAQLLSDTLNKAATYAKDDNLPMTIHYLALSATMTAFLKDAAQQANATGITAFNDMGNQEVDMVTLLDTFKALLEFFEEGLPLIAEIAVSEV